MSEQINRKLVKEELIKEKRINKIKEKALETQRNRVYDNMVNYEKKHKKERKISPKDSFISLQNINKIYDNRVQAVYDFNLEVKKHEFIVFVGPSGCGKSTTLRMIAGLENITAGDLYIDGIYANDLEPKNRDIAMVFQSYALYPHMSVAGNMSFGLKIRKVPTLMKNKDGNVIKTINKGLISDLEKERKNLISYRNECLKDNPSIIEQLDKDIVEYDEKITYLSTTPVDLYKNKHLSKEEIKNRVLNAADILEIREYLDRKPKALSGGQCQRVALGRAIVRNAKVFLMDEPLSNLDAKLRVQMRSEIIKLHNQLKATTIYVTHDQTEAMTMATRIVVMSKGYIQQIGTPIEIYNHPANLFVATFIGSPAMNLFKGKLKDSKVSFAGNETLVLEDSYMKESTKFYKEELAKYKIEKEELLTNFKERNDLLDKIQHLEEKSIKALKEITELERLKEHVIHVTEANDRLVFLEEAIKKYQKFIKNKEYEVIFGIRPEDIYQSKHAYTDGFLSENIKGKITVAELLGHEYFIHLDYANKDLVAKIAAKKLFNADDDISIVFDLSKAHIFDSVSSKLIK